MGETRREFLKKTSLGTLGFILGQAGKANIANSQKVQATTAAPVTPEQKSESETQPALLVGGVMLSQAVSTPQPAIPIQKEDQPQKKEEPQKEAREISLLFPNATPLEKSKAREMLDKQIIHYKSEPEYEKRVYDTIRWKNMIFESAKNLGFRENSPVPTLLLSLVYVESGGDPAASPSKDKDAAEGLCQIKLSTALPIARRLEMKTPPNLFDPRTNIALTLEYFDRLFKLFPDPSLAFWVYHLGEGNLAKAIKRYVVWEKGANGKIVDAILDDVKLGTAHLVKEYGLNFVNLISSKSVVQELKDNDAFNNDTQFHVPRVGAATSLLNE